MGGEAVLEEVGSARATSVERSNWHAGVSHPDIWGQSTKAAGREARRSPGGNDFGVKEPRCPRWSRRRERTYLRGSRLPF